MHQLSKYSMSTIVILLLTTAARFGIVGKRRKLVLRHEQIL